MAKKFNYKHTDTEAVLRVNANLVGSDIRVQVRPMGAINPLPDLSATITNPAKGEITVTIGTLPIGTYELEIEQNQAGRLAHYPNKGFDLLIIGEDLDQ